MTTDFNQVLERLQRSRTDFETRLAEIPAWRALKGLEAAALSTAVSVDATVRQPLLDSLKGNRVYQEWLEIGAAMTKLVVDAARGLPPTLPSAVAEVVARAQTSAASAAAGVPVPPDDLMRLRGMTQAYAVALHRMGVRRFAEIAGWTAADVQRISSGLGLGDAISRLNWIEQAAARSAATRKTEPAPAIETKSETKPTQVVPEPPQPEPSDDLTRIRGITPAIAAELMKLGETSFARIANWTAADVARVGAALGLGAKISRQSWIEQAALRVPASALRVAAPREPAPVASAGNGVTAESAARIAGAAVAAAAGSEAAAKSSLPAQDNLTAIRIITPRLAEQLKDFGVATFDDIANWSSLDVERIASALALGDRISREAWIEQAAMRVLRKGGTLKPATVVRTARPAPAAAPQQSPAVEAPAVPPIPPAAAPAPVVPPAFASALAAIKAELVAPVMVSATVPAAPAAPTKAHVTESAEPDLLDCIAGIDAAAASKLARLGVTRFADIAGWTAAEVARIEASLGQPLAVRRGNWIEQAAVLARGGVTSHATRVARGDLTALVPRPGPALQPLAPVAPVLLTGSAPAIGKSEPSGGTGVDAAVAELQAIADAAAARLAAAAAPRSVPSLLAEVASGAAVPPPSAPAPVVPPSLPVQASSPIAAAASASTAPAAQPVGNPWPRMTEPGANRQAAGVNAMPGAADPNPAPPPLEPPAMVTQPVPGSRAMDGGLAAALAAAAASASATPRLSPGRLGEHIRSLPAVSADPYLEDLSDWVQDAADDLPAASSAGLSGGEADVAIVRAAITTVGDLGAVTPGADRSFDAAGYAAYRREVQEASVEIIGDGSGMGHTSQAAPSADAGERGLKRLIRALRGEPSRR